MTAHKTCQVDSCLLQLLHCCLLYLSPVAWHILVQRNSLLTQLKKWKVLPFVLQYKVRKKNIAIPAAIPNQEKYWQYGGNTQKVLPIILQYFQYCIFFFSIAILTTLVIFAVFYLQPQCHPYRVRINCELFYINVKNLGSLLLWLVCVCMQVCVCVYRERMWGWYIHWVSNIGNFNF